MNLDIYKPEIRYQNNSVIAGKSDAMILPDHQLFRHQPILAEFLKDDDLQEITIVSTNVGFIKTFTKSYKGGPL